MSDTSPVIDRLMKAIGAATDQSLYLTALEQDNATFPGDLQAEEMTRLAESSIHDGAPGCMRTSDGRWVGGLALKGNDPAHVLVAQQNPDVTFTPGKEEASLEILTCLAQLIEGGQTAQAESDQLIEELNNTYEDLHLFARVTARMRSLHYTDSMVRELMQETLDTMGLDLASVLLVGEDAPDTIITSKGNDKIPPEPATFLATLCETMPRLLDVFEENCFILNDSDDVPEFKALHTHRFRAIQVAVRSGENFYGWLVLASMDMTRIFRRGEYRMLSTMAEQFSLLMANTELYRNLESFLINMVRGFVGAIEAKDRYTKGHSERVCMLSMRIGKALELRERDFATLQWASILHDIGKIGTPEAILNKPGKLTDEEYDQLKNHSVDGVEILRPIEQLADTLPAIRGHHERIDGRGYPDGLAGEDIPFLARIIAVADTYDAITTNRAYRDGRSHDVGMQIVRDCAGTQLDEKIVAVFDKLMTSASDGEDTQDVRDMMIRMSTSGLFRSQESE